MTLRASLVAQRLKRLPPMQETQVRSLGLEDPLEKEMVTHSSILLLLPSIFPSIRVFSNEMVKWHH